MPKLAALLSSREGRQAGEALTGTEDALLPMAAALGHVDMIEDLLDAGRCTSTTSLPCWPAGLPCCVCSRCRPHACAVLPCQACRAAASMASIPSSCACLNPDHVTAYGVEDCTHYRITGLWMAAFYGPPNALRCIDLLLSKGANINATSREKTTHLAMAAMNGAWRYGG